MGGQVGGASVLLCYPPLHTLIPPLLLYPAALGHCSTFLCLPSPPLLIFAPLLTGSMPQAGAGMETLGARARVKGRGGVGVVAGGCGAGGNNTSGR